MNKIMFKLLILLGFFCILCNYTFAIDVSSTSSITTSCTEADVDAHYYIPNGQNNLTIYPVDNFSNSNVNVFIRNAETSVRLWQNTSGIMSCGNWWRISNVVPTANGSYMIVGGDGCTLSKTQRTNVNQPAAQIMYRVAFKREQGLGTGTSNYYYYRYPSSTQISLADQTRRVWGNIQYSGNECFNIYTHWCGDGVVDTSYGETCDPNAPGWTNVSCNQNTCQPIPSTCNSLTANPDNGDSPLNSTATCNGTNVRTFSINCGNGQIFSGNGSNNGAESFSRTCNYTSAGTYTQTCTINGTITNSSCRDTVTVIDNIYDLALRKTVTSTGPYSNGSTVRFNVQVFNQGNVDSGSVTITDYIPTGFTLNDSNWTQNGNLATRTISNITAGSSQNLSIQFTVNSQATGTVTNWAEISSDSGNDCDSTPDQNNTNDGTVIDDDIGTGCNSGGDEDDHDPASITITSITPVCTGLTVIPNSGSAPLLSNFTCTGNNVSTYSIEVRNSTGTLINTINSNTGSYTFGAIGNYTASCFVNGQTTTPAVCIQPITVGSVSNFYDLALRKTVTSTGPYSSGSIATFNIQVFNQGTISSGNIELTDYISTGLTLNDASWTQSGSLATRTIGSIAAGANQNLSIQFIVNGQASGTVTNWVEISNDNGNDCDSTPDQDNTNDGTVIDDDIGNGCNAGGDEDDHDPASITLGGSGGPSCNTLSLSPTSGDAPVDSIATCNGTDVTDYSIDCGNGQVFSGTGTNNGSETFTATCSYTSNTSYSARCTINGTLTNASCTATASFGGGSSTSSSNGGGGGPNCNRIDIGTRSDTGTGFTTPITCEGNDRVRSMKIECGNGDIYYGNAYEVNGRKYFDHDCTYESLTSQVYRPKCSVSSTLGALPENITDSTFMCRGNISLGDNFCGDGVLQRPNTNGEMEECERTFNPDGSLGDWPDFCSSSCEIREITTPRGDGIITIPNDGEIIFGPVDSIVIGNGMNPFQELSERPFIKNASSYDLYFDYLCVTKKEGNTLDGTTTCGPLRNSILYPGDVEELSSYPNYTGNISSIPSTESYGDNTLVTTIRHDGVLYTDAYFAAEFDVRVSKPSIASVGGGTNYIGDTSKIANISSVADGIENPDINKNFIGIGVSIGSLSSYSEQIQDNSSVEQIGREGEVYEDTINDLETTTSGSMPVYSLISTEIENYNGIENVYILKGQNLEISEIPSSLSGPRTYIIEDGDLIITGDLVYSDNIAFVVKGKDIIIDKDVLRIDGTYISIPKTTGGGNIKGHGGATNNILQVNGNLYGNIADLVNLRQYVRNNSDNGQINVGTIVSFGSSSFRKTAPLIGQFIGEYLESIKVAR